MFRDSFKWILIALAVACCLTGVFLGVRFAPADKPPVEAEPPRPSLSPAADLPNATPASIETPAPTATPEPQTAEEWAEIYLQSMPIEDKLGQLVMFGFSGTQSVSDAFSDLMERYHVGNAILYGANIKNTNGDGGFTQCQKLTNNVRSHIAQVVPPLIAIDVEGGSVVRFRWRPSLSSARTLGRRDDTQKAYEQFLLIGTRLIDVGINLDLAPVLDVSEDPMKTILQTRIISSDEAVASRIGAAMIEGLHAGGCLSAAKHFPGHGGTTADSHTGTPIVKRSAEDLAAYDLVPFAAAIDAGVDAIMTAHILYPALDETDAASTSHAIITGLLREQMGFSGIVISDDFRMNGLLRQYDAGEAAVRFVLAGGDLIICGADSDLQAAIMAGLHDAYRAGRLTEARIDESVRRILQKKLAVTDWDAETAARALLLP